MQQGWTLPVMNLRFYYVLIMVVSLFAINANGAPMAYSINSDSNNTTDADHLYLIDLENGSAQKKPLPLFSGAFHPNDFEGLAFAPDGTLWGIDDGFISSYPTMFPINPESGAGNPLQTESVSFNGLQTGGQNDFGMTFACDNSLYVTSVGERELYRLGLDGSVEVIGNLGVDVHISAIAAIGNPTRLYGLGNGRDDSGATDSPYLYSISTLDGSATEIGPLGMSAIGPVYPYHEGGLAFASDGTLWAITDRSLLDGQGSQILSINVGTGAATHISYTSEIGFESLAITSPTDCLAAPSDNASGTYPRIPTLGPAGLLLSIFTLMFAGMVFLRRRVS